MNSRLRHEPHFTPVKIEETSALVARDLAYQEDPLVIEVSSLLLKGNFLFFKFLKSYGDRIG
jgi:hypothetical protein